MNDTSQPNEFNDTDHNRPGDSSMPKASGMSERISIREVMSENVKVIRPDASIAEAARMMREADVGALPVCDGERVQGIVTDRDIVINGLAQGNDTELPVSEVMTSDIEYVFENESVEEAANKMEKMQIRRLIVLDDEKKLRGILSLGDVSKSVREQKAGKTLEGISKSA